MTSVGIRQGSGHRGERSGKKSRKAVPLVLRDRKVHHHSLFGAIPMVPVYVDRDGEQVISHWSYDSTYRPPMPPGAVRGDITKQRFFPPETPKYFYVDETKTCVQCGQKFTFSAGEQKYWFETLRFNFNARAIRCRSCRRQRRSDQAIRRQLALTVEAVVANPKDPSALLDLAEATVVHHERFETGDLNRAIASAREAHRLVPGLHEAIYLEARCHLAAGRGINARTLFEEFIKIAAGVSRCVNLSERAKQELAR